MLELKNITVTIEEDGIQKKILDNLCMQVKDNLFIAVTGPNGGGKSTLAKVIMGIVKPTSGRIFFEGRDITDLSIKERADLGIGFAFQQPVRFKGLNVADLISFAAKKEMPREVLCDYLTTVGLCALDYIDRSVDDSLSGGEMKRIEIATILARDVRLNIFDEPEAGIDIWSFQNLIDIFREMQKKRNSTILIISHQERILAIADEIVVISDGKIAGQGPGNEMLPKLLSAQENCDFCPSLLHRKEGL